MKEKKIAVLGLGYVGLPLALQLSLSYNVVGYDIDNTRIKELRKGIDKTLEVSEASKVQPFAYFQVVFASLFGISTVNTQVLKYPVSSAH